MKTEFDIGAAFQAARRYHCESNGPGPHRRPAHLALKRAREMAVNVAQAQVAYDATPAGQPRAEHDALSRLSEAKRRAGQYMGNSWKWHGFPGNWSEDRTAYYVASRDQQGAGLFRWIQPAHEIPENRLEHTGYYTDDSYSETMFGVVASLPGKDGKPRYLAGWQQSDTDAGPTLSMGQGFFDCPRDAARHADGLAERAAEREQVFNRIWNAGRVWAELGETINAARAEARALLAERRKARAALAPDSFTASCKAIRGRVSQLVEAISEAREERANLEDLADVNPDAWKDGVSAV